MDTYDSNYSIQVSSYTCNSWRISWQHFANKEDCNTILHTYTDRCTTCYMDIPVFSPPIIPFCSSDSFWTAFSCSSRIFWSCFQFWLLLLTDFCSNPVSDLLFDSHRDKHSELHSSFPGSLPTNPFSTELVDPILDTFCFEGCLSENAGPTPANVTVVVSPGSAAKWHNSGKTSVKALMAGCALCFAYSFNNSSN